MSEIRVFPRHSRGHGYKYCVPTMKLRAKKYGIDFRRFVKYGIPISEIEHIKDHGVQTMIAAAKKEAEDGR